MRILRSSLGVTSATWSALLYTPHQISHFLIPYGEMKLQNGHDNVSILDIREEELSLCLLDDIHQLLRPGEGEEKRMPTMLLYDAAGLQLFEDITYLEEYYLTNAEIEVLENYSGEIAKLVPAGSILLELGSGYVLISLRRNSSHNSPPIAMAVA